MKSKSHKGILILLYGLSVCFFVQSVSTNVLAQEGKKFFGSTKVTVKLDANSSIPEADIPFDRYFYIRKYIPESIPDPMFAYMFEVDEDGNQVSIPANNGIVSTIKAVVYRTPGDSDKPDIKGFKAFDILISPLKPVNPVNPHKNYKLSYIFSMTDERLAKFAQAFIHIRKVETSQATRIVKEIESEKKFVSDKRIVSMMEMDSYYKDHLKEILDGLSLSNDVEIAAAKAIIIKELKTQKLILSPDLLPTIMQPMFVFYDDAPEPNPINTQSAKLETRAGTYVQPDFGAVYYGFLGGSRGYDISPDFHGITPYVGVSILARPFDADISLRDVVRYQKLKFYHRLSLQLGLTLTSLAKDRYRSNLFGAFNPMIGIGYRLTSTFKIHAGSVLYNQIDSNPLLDMPRVRGIGYLGVSLDLRIREVLKDVGKLLTPGAK